MNMTILACTSALMLCSSCAGPYIAVEPRYGNLELDGDVAVASGAITSSNSLDAVGLDDAEGTFGARVDARWLMPHLTVWGSQSSFDGDGTLEADLSQGGNTIVAGTDVKSDFDFDMLAGVLTFDLFPGDTFELGIGFGAALLALDASITDPVGAADITLDESLPMPLVSARLGAQFWRLDVEALLSGMALDVDGNDATFYDLDLAARMRVLGSGDHATGHLVLGYRHVALDVDYDDGGDAVELDLEFTGPYIGLRILF